ncbi:SDR family oxidoreductase [Croceicoccus ponticola]|uniref:SDR family oxidoreductase n=1 Tax=Croceicoccus ponticola TaxID=2217664 RepID=A0A437GUJ0_9SPHN|nr:SDR family oxidoreductase [Croceicoccus ponticola]RVQ65158.1 SDR family oxidoreductase [Croceicoccus ponticola]
MRLEGKRALVIGAAETGNMGQAIARRLKSEGCDVTVSSRRIELLQEFARELGGHAVACDLTDRDSVFALAEEASSRMGGIDIAINSTGVAVGGPFVDFAEADLDKLIDLQFKGSFFFLQAMVKAMQASGGSIIQISSAVAQPGTTVDGGYEAYMGTKAGIDQVVRAVANQFGKLGIRVNSIAAGHTDTPMHHENFGGSDIPDWMKACFADCYPLGRYGTSDDIAEGCVWLGQDNCFMTGQVLQLNGGLTLRRNPLMQDLERYQREYENG